MTRHRRPVRRGRRVAVVVGAIAGAVVVLALVAALIAALVIPRAVRGVATRALTEVPGYSGRVGNVDFSLRTGSLSLRDVVIDVETDAGGEGGAGGGGRDAQRLATIPRMDVEIDLDGPIFERRFAYKAIVRSPVVTVRGAARKEWIVGGAKEVAETSEGRIDRRIPFSGPLPDAARDPWMGLREVLSEGMVTGLRVGGEQG